MNASFADYAEHLTEADLRLLSAVVPVTDGAQPALPGGAKPGLAGDRSAIEALLADPRVFEAVFGRAAVAAGQAVLVSPFLAFGVAVHRAVADLSDLDYLPERSGRQRVPVFDAPELRDFLGSAAAHALGPLDATRLLRSARVPSGERDELAAAPALELLEYLGARWYRAALAAAPVRTANLAVVGEVAARFRQARRILNHLADRYLLGPDSPWFAQPGPP